MERNKEEILYRSVVISVIVKMCSFIMNWFFVYIVGMSKPLALVGLTFVVLIYYIVAIKYEYIKIASDEVFYNRGVIFKKSLRIHKERLKSLDISKNIIGQIFSFSTVKIETAVMGGVEDTTIRMYLSDKKIDEIKIYLLERENSSKEIINEDENVEAKKIEKEEIILTSKISNKDLFMSGLTSAGFVVVIFAIFQGVFFLTEIGQEDVLNSTMDFAMSNIGDLHLGFLISIFIISFIFINIASGVVSIIKFYNFTLTVTDTKINIKYGLINVREFSFVRSDINAVVIGANPIRQLFKCSDIKLDVKGYNGFGDAAITLTPFIKNANIDSVFKYLLTDFIIEEEEEKFEKGRLVYLSKPIICNFIASIIFLIVFKDPIVLSFNLISLIFIASGLLVIKNTSLSYNTKILKGVHGGFYKIEKRIKPRSIQAVRSKQSRMLDRLKIATIIIYYYSEVGGAIGLNHLSKDNLQKLSRISRGLGVDTDEDKQNECYENIR